MPALGDLRREILPNAIEVEPLGEAASREVAWVRVMKARVPAFDVLEPGDLAILPAAVLESAAPSLVEQSALVGGFVRARVAAIVVLGGEGHATGELADAAVRAGVPVLRLAEGEPAALERSIIGYLVNRRAELDRQAGAIEASVRRLALEGRGLDVMVGAVAEFLGRAVALEGRRGELLAVAAPTISGGPGSGGASGAPGPEIARYLAAPRSAAALRVPILGAGSPVGGDERGAVGAGGVGRGVEERAGSLALLGEPPASDLDRAVGERIAALLSFELARDTALRRARDAALRLDALPPAGPPWVLLLVRVRETDAALPGSRDAAAALAAQIRELAPPRRVTVRDDANPLELLVDLAVEPADPAGLAFANRIAELTVEAVMLSAPFADPSARASVESELRLIAESAARARAGAVLVRADRAPAYRLLAGLRLVPEGIEQARALLAPILGERDPRRRERLATLRAVIESPGLGEAAAALGIHRNTLAYRLRALEADTGWDLDDPDLRLALAVALRIVDPGA